MKSFRKICLDELLLGPHLIFRSLTRSFSLSVAVALLGSVSSCSSTSSLEHRQSYPKKQNAISSNKKTMSKSPSLSSRASAGIYGFFNQAFLVFFILVCL